MIIPKEAKSVLKELEKKGFEAYLVGGCVRDLLIEVDPKDWDVTTNAEPTQIQKTFPKNFAENKFGTVTVITGSKKETLKEIEITPYRTEAKYTDKRHPDKVEWAKTLKEDLSRRDFTVNAMAMDIKGEVIDLYDGQKDLKNLVVKAVGKADDRFSEDALRMIRAVRIACVLGFKIEDKTKEAILKNSNLLNEISKERVRDELLKIIMSERANLGIDMLRELELLKHVIPELLEGYNVEQNKHHIYGVYEHSLLSLKYASEKGFSKHVRIASLLHDIGKPRTKRGEGSDSTFYNHEIVGANMTRKILDRLKFSKKDADKIIKLVRYHLFYYNVDEVKEASVRRLVTRVGIDNMDDLLEVRMADRIGSGVPKAEPYKLRHLKYIIEKVSKDPITVSMLKVSGKDIMKETDMPPGPKVGWILDILLDIVLKDPKKNKKDFLIKEIKKLASEKDLKVKAQESKNKKQKIEEKEDNMTKKKYWVV